MREPLSKPALAAWLAVLIVTALAVLVVVALLFRLILGNPF
jgi:hypothetical protein